MGTKWVVPIVLIVVLMVSLYFIFGRSGSKPSWESGRQGETALEILKKPYARGKITKAKFEAMKKDI